MRLALLPVCLTCAAVAAAPAALVAASPETPIASAAIARSDGSALGTATIDATGNQTRLTITLRHVPPGVHGMHFHATGTCSGQGFAAAGAHLNPAARQHGIDNPAGSHLGDLPNVEADAQGNVSAQITLPVLAKDLSAALFDADGAALVLHADRDDYLTDPSGNSGTRIACGVLIPRR